MAEVSKPLPEFDNPPVVEVVLSVLFESLSSLRTPQLGLLWQEFRDKYPVTAEHAPLDSEIERFGVPPTSKGVARIQMLSSPPVPRCWFLNEQGTELVQVQQDRFIHNWRKVGDHHTYPRYEHVRATFERELLRFSEFLAQQQLGELRPNQCEVTYVNHIMSGEGWKTHGELNSVLTLFTPQYTDDFRPNLEDGRLSARYVIPKDKGEPIGRLHLAVEPAYRSADDMPLLALTLTARGRPLSDDLPGVLAFLDVGREWIVRMFASITTPTMHNIWRRTL